MKALFPVANQIQGDRAAEEPEMTDNEQIFFIIEAKKSGDGKGPTTLFTLDHFQEMIALDEFLINLAAPAEMAAEIGVDHIGMYDLCKRENITDEIVVKIAAEACLEISESFCLDDIAEKCAATPRPLDFIYDRKTDSYDLSPYDSDIDLVAKV